MSDNGFFGFHFIKIIGVYSLLFIMMILNLINMPFLGEDGGKLSFLLIGIYFWLIFKPSLIPYPLLFAAGLMLDFLSGGLVGVYTFCFMILGIIVRNQRKFLLGQSWSVVWAGFCVAVVIMTFIQFLAYSLAYLTFPPLLPMCFGFAISCLLYPLLLPPLMLLNRLLND
jgi:rod shape-determining protein MreD